MADVNGVNALQSQVDSLDDSFVAAAEMAAGFGAELQRVRAALEETGKDAQTLERGLSRGLRRALDGVLFNGASAGEALRGVVGTAGRVAYSAAARPITDQFGGLIAQSLGSLVQSVTPFAKGGIVNAPTYFPMRGGAGLMGEAGPEAIVPLSRGPDGRLGIRSAGAAQPVQVVMNISTPDADGFRRSQSQIAAQMSRAIARGQRNR
ncbi:phage tail tape measure protein [Pseudooceanicola sp. CBS1P-1]|uniref:Phage tail tape measure protein n=1 Tax=Pseudooceanicola albus TaxID=2692189 RepID=A0A6L7GA71_9RHOB|nr:MULTISPECIES: phage tail tape measure protein [Pseudooceanicola]MBT9384257.1 phage tail tape measure protein [Pseudooceanicola endophyticus]MXN20849.1 phage tail tape measure protein [Pseudooceanicola albus]